MMLRWSLLTLSLALASIALGAENALAQTDFSCAAVPYTTAFCPEDFCAADECCCCLYGRVEALFLDRTNPADKVAVIRVTDEFDPVPGQPVLASGDLNFEWGAGVSALVGWHLGECVACEVEYKSPFCVRAATRARGDNDLAIPGDLGLASLDFFGADEIGLEYQSELHSVEVNYAFACCGCTLLAGFRYVHLDEEFNLQGTDADSGTSNYHIRALNNLNGGQLGLRFEQSHCTWGWDLTAKAGVFGNNAQQTQSVSDFGSAFFLRRPYTASDGNTAFVGDINLSILHYLTDVWALRGGYNLLWVEGVALAPDQLDFTRSVDSGRQLRDDAGVFWHGLTLGLEARW